MKKILLIITVLSSFVFSSCLKDNNNACNQEIGNPQATTAEIATLQAYLTTSGITSAVQHSSGMFYTIISAGTGTSTPGQCNVVAVRYSGKLTNGSIFDQSTTPQGFNLYNLIMGWRIGIPLIKSGGTIRLFIPPSLGYGDRAVGSIPANSILIFDIDLVSVT